MKKEKTLRNMSRSELVEIIYELESREKELEKENADLKEQLENRIIMINEAGSMAEAAVKINKLLEVAQQTADDYLNSIRAQKLETIKKTEEIVRKTNEQAQAYLLKVRNSTKKK